MTVEQVIRHLQRDPDDAAMLLSRLKVSEWESLRNEGLWKKMPDDLFQTLARLPGLKIPEKHCYTDIFPRVIHLEKTASRGQILDSIVSAIENKDQWKWILPECPELALRCNCWEAFRREDLNYLRDNHFWDNLDRNKLRNLLLKHPMLENKCDWGKLEGSDWVILLNENSKSFADKCDWTKLKDYDWMNLLRKHPDFADKCDLAKLNGDVWLNLLLAQPQFAELDIPWKILTGDNTDEKYLWELEQSGFWRKEFWKDEKNKETLMLILECYPKVSLFFSWEHFQNDAFNCILNKLKPDILLQLWKDKPQLGERIHDWSSFTPDYLRELLCERPDLANRHVLERLDLHNAAELLRQQPCIYPRFEAIFLDKQEMSGTKEDNSVIRDLRVDLHGENPSTCTPNGTTGKTGEHKHILNEKNIPLKGKQLRGPDGRFESFGT